MRRPVFIALGSNIDPEQNLRRAVALLADRLPIRAVSRVYATSPVGGATGPAFLNAAVRADTDIPPKTLKFDVLRGIEARLGRVRPGRMNASRTIDLDLALCGDLVIDDPATGLLVPHPDILKWPHIALPLADVGPDFVHPVDGRPLARIAADVSGAGGIQPTDIALAGLVVRRHRPGQNCY